jgi:tetratricopeptide (TPR) repeat protein
VRQYDKAIASELDCIRRDPEGAWSRTILAWAYQQQGKHAEACAALHEAVKLRPNSPFTLAAYGQALAAAGDRTGAQDVLGQLAEKAKTRYVSSYDVALIYAALKDRDEAFRRLDRAREEHSTFLPLITWDRRADSLRGDPRYAALIGQLGLPPLRAGN